MAVDVGHDSHPHISVPNALKMEDPDLIATLIPTDNFELAKNAFRLPHNHDRYFAPTGGFPTGPTISSREPTPAGNQPNDGSESSEYNCTHSIRLTFSEKPKNPTRGFLFGTNPLACDVLLGYRGMRGLSGLHFCIAFNEQGHVIVKDFSTCGTAVSYDGQARHEVRRDFTWILDLKRGSRQWDIKVHVPKKDGLEFKIILASHKTCEAKYIENVNSFLAERRTALPPLSVLGIDSHTTAQPSQPLTPRQRPIYIEDRKLGSDTFAVVHLITDVSTGSKYARKRFYKPSLWERDRKKRERQEEKWLETIRRETDIMRSNPHVNKHNFAV